MELQLVLTAGTFKAFPVSFSDLPDAAVVDDRASSVHPTFANFQDEWGSFQRQRASECSEARSLLQARCANLSTWPDCGVVIFFKSAGGAFC